MVQQRRLSTGAIVGIVVGSLFLFGLLIIGIGALIGVPESSKSSSTRQQKYTYSGPPYEIVYLDETGKVWPRSYYIFSDKMNTESPSFEAQVKAVFTDIAHKNNSANFAATIWSNKEVIDWKYPKTALKLMTENGEEYKNRIVALEEKNTVAMYTSKNDGSMLEHDTLFYFPSSETPKAHHEFWTPKL